MLIGPGKIELLRAVAEHGSISAAARALGLGYKRAWSLLDELQKAVPKAILETAAGDRTAVSKGASWAGSVEDTRPLRLLLCASCGTPG